MTEVLLKELSNSDIDWILATGQQQEIAAGTVLVRQGKADGSLYILLEGMLSVTVSQTINNPLTRAFAALEGGESEREITRLGSGEVVGEIPFVGLRPLATTIKAAETSIVMAISQQQLATKLQQDSGFAARFYRAIAIMFSDRLQNLIEQFGRSNLAQGKPLKDVLFVLGEMNDSDIDWMMACGTQQKIAANIVLIQAGRPIDALYILLGGTLSVSFSEDERNPLTRAFAVLESSERSGREVARLSKGEIAGEIHFLDARLPSVTVRSLEDSLVLSIPRQQLTSKLQQDSGFASRFYRVIATLLANRLQEMLNKFTHGRRVYSKEQLGVENIEDEDELDSSVLDRMVVAGTKFNWMLGHLRSSV